MFTGFELLFLAFSGASAAGIASTRKVTRGAFAPTQYREYEEPQYEEPQAQRFQQQRQPPLRGGEVHVKRKGSSFYVTAMIADVAFMAVIDTGASTCKITHKVLRDLGVDLRSIRPDKWNEIYDTAAGPVRAMTVPLDLNVMGIERQGVACGIMEQEAGGNLIGMSFLSTLSSCEQRGNLLIMRP